MRQTPDVVDGGDAVRKARKQLVELSLLALQLIDRLRKVVAECVERAREDAEVRAKEETERKIRETAERKAREKAK